MDDLERVIGEAIDSVRAFALFSFEQAGGDDWRSDLVLGGASAVLALAVFVIVVSGYAVLSRQTRN